MLRTCVVKHLNHLDWRVRCFAPHPCHRLFYASASAAHQSPTARVTLPAAMPPHNGSTPTVVHALTPSGKKAMVAAPAFISREELLTFEGSTLVYLYAHLSGQWRPLRPDVSKPRKHGLVVSPDFTFVGLDGTATVAPDCTFRLIMPRRGDLTAAYIRPARATGDEPYLTFVNNVLCSSASLSPTDAQSQARLMIRIPMSDTTEGIFLSSFANGGAPIWAETDDGPYAQQCRLTIAKVKPPREAAPTQFAFARLVDTRPDTSPPVRSPSPSPMTSGEECKEEAVDRPQAHDTAPPVRDLCACLAMCFGQKKPPLVATAAVSGMATPMATPGARRAMAVLASPSPGSDASWVQVGPYTGHSPDR